MEKFEKFEITEVEAFLTKELGTYTECWNGFSSYPQRCAAIGKLLKAKYDKEYIKKFGSDDKCHLYVYVDASEANVEQIKQLVAKFLATKNFSEKMIAKLTNGCYLGNIAHDFECNHKYPCRFISAPGCSAHGAVNGCQQYCFPNFLEKYSHNKVVESLH